MIAFVVRRLLQMLPMLLALSILVFGLMQVAPGGPTAYLLPTDLADPEQEQRLIESLGLDRPIWVQYLSWLGAMLTGDFGTAYSYGQPVLDVVGSRLEPTLQLQVTAILFSIVLAVPIGIIAAVHRYRTVDHVVTTTSLLGLSMPNFWFALMLILAFSVHLGVLPSFGSGEGTLLARWPYFVMPVLVLGLSTIPWYARFMRANMIDTLRQDYIRAAQARGFSTHRIIFRHALKPALLPVITIVGLSLPRLIGGSVIVETIFAWPGLGRLAYDSILRQDYPVVMALTLLTGAFVMIVNLVTDLTYTLVDPRISYE